MNANVFKAFQIEIAAAEHRSSEYRRPERKERELAQAAELASLADWLRRQDPEWVKGFVGTRIGVYEDGTTFGVFSPTVRIAAKQYGWK